MRFRIGINLGDVIEDEDCIYDDGIDVAARVEGLAEGGGISSNINMPRSIEKWANHLISWCTAISLSFPVFSCKIRI